jgi:hypothetical protein
MAKEDLIATLRQIKALVDDAITKHVGHGREPKKPSEQRVAKSVKIAEPSFNMNLLAFMKQNAQGLSGPNKFTLLLAGVVKGSVSQEVSSSELKRQWNKMKVIIGKFNGAHANRAKANGWVDTPKHGIYTLSHSWKEALKRSNG